MENPNFIIIDGSYFVFFRSYALLSWFKLAKKDEEMDENYILHHGGPLTRCLGDLRFKQNKEFPPDK